MTTEEFEAVLVAHRAWLTGAADGARANLTRVNLSGADLSGAYLSGADLSGADLSDANLSDANLSGANLSRANLSDANLSGAYLSDANLSDANLSDANLSRAYLSGTCLDPALTTHARAFCRACPVDADGYRVVYRTATSQHVGSASYEPGQTYTAPNLSWDAATACHPGIYAGSLDVIRQMFPNIPLIRCRVLDGDWVITAKGCIRCAQLEVLSAVPVGPDGKGS